ncbi:MAG: S53 family peptidase [Bacteroidota bacterium]|nr:S53 family peptidase [Bacteroidota bacterium]
MSKSKKDTYVVLPGTEKAAPKASKAAHLSPDQSMEVTVRIRRKSSVEPHLEKDQRYTREEYEKKFGSSDEDIAAVEAFAHEHNLSISNIDKARRSVMLKATVKDFEDAFKVKMECYSEKGGHTFRGRSGEISIPTELKDIVEGVFGLDDRPHSRPMFQVRKSAGNIVAHAASQSYNPNDLAKIYGFPTNATGKGQTIAIIELGGGYKPADIKKYFAGLGIKQPSVVAVSVDGGKNNPTTADSADGEVMLDIEVAGAVATGAKIVVYFAPNTDKGFLDAITQAIHDKNYKPSVISISWGSAEKNWTQQSLTSFNEAFKAASLLGVTICAAAGDQGSSDSETDGKVHADFPSSSPYVLSCGGTKLIANGNTITSETVWHEANDSATGGGVSDFFPLPDYQKKIKVPAALSTGFKGRGLPDVAANADPNTGYNVLVDGQAFVIGGTSAVAPLMAGLIALINEKKPQPVGFIHPHLYSTPGLCRDITQGDNKTTTTQLGYQAAKGWDPCTGWGVLSKL